MFCQLHLVYIVQQVNHIFYPKHLYKSGLIYQDNLDNQTTDFTIYSERLPDNPDSFSVEELEESGFKKMIKLIGEKKEIDGKLARKYIYRIPEDKIKELLELK